MLKFTEVTRRETLGTPSAPALPVADSLEIKFDTRKRSRFRAVLVSGAECAVVVPRGTVLRDGDLLTDDTGATSVRVRAAVETLSQAVGNDALLLTRVAYHLGNRHVSLQIEPGQLTYLHDHVLDEMVRALGLPVATVQAPFQPESGAYGGGHRHAGDEGHDHDHDHDHDHC
ncbi:MAG: hypothetical protein RJA70_2245 [Pseudomonadota bacterium]